MKLFDKVKNMFTEEVEEEVQVEQVKPAKKKKQNSAEAIEQIKEEKKKEEEKKPIFFTDDDFNDMDSYRLNDREEKQEIKVDKETKKEDKIDKYDRYDDYDKYDKYEYDEEPVIPHRSNAPYEEVKTIKKFKPTPIISPVYGILDKNYHKEDIVDKSSDEYNAVDGLSVDSIRNKAYGTLEDELENTLFGNNSILFDGDEKKEDVLEEVAEESENDLLDELTDKDEETLKKDTEELDKDLDDLENITMDIGKELDSLLSKKNPDNEESEEDLFDLIDNMYEGDDENDN